MNDSQTVVQPVARRPWQMTPLPTRPSTPPSPSNDSSASGLPPGRTRSILNLTSSTLFGIYSPTEGANGFGSTPWATPRPASIADAAAFERHNPSTWGLEGTATPKGESLDMEPPVIGAFERSGRRRSPSLHTSTFADVVVRATMRTICLFVFGMAHGVVVTHLHGEQRPAPMPVKGLDRHAWPYMVFWGMSGVALGSLLPWIDALWEEGSISRSGTRRNQARQGRRPPGVAGGSQEKARPLASESSGMGANWNAVVRSIGAFIGIGFAIRRLPWQSTLQASLTLALVNPVLWYLIDRTMAGFAFSTAVGLTGTAILLGTDIVPSPGTAPHAMQAGNVTYHNQQADSLSGQEHLGIWIWIASVLFCSSVCFGNIGRRLAAAGRGEGVM